MIETTSKLPDTLWELLDVALADLRAVEADDRYAVSMGFWHAPIDGTCVVCAAGAVMAESLGVSPGRSVLPEYFDDITAKKLCVINSLRMGHVEYAAERLGVPTSIKSRSVAHYVIDRDQFYADMTKLRDDLKAAGV